jgi:hypothetical protein
MWVRMSATASVIPRFDWGWILAWLGRFIQVSTGKKQRTLQVLCEYQSNTMLNTITACLLWQRDRDRIIDRDTDRQKHRKRDRNRDRKRQRDRQIDRQTENAQRLWCLVQYLYNPNDEQSLDHCVQGPLSLGYFPMEGMFPRPSNP